MNQSTFTPEYFQRFGEAVLSQRDDDKCFRLDLTTIEDLDAVVAAFERMGCTVERDPIQPRIWVTPPRS